MFTKTKTALVAAIVIGSASVAMADDLWYPPESVDNTRASNPQAQYQQAAPIAQPRASLIEGRNVGIAGQGGFYSLQNEQRQQLDRNSADFNS
jgi:hypothetical protein